MTLSQLWAMLKPWRWWLALVGVSVLLGAVLELVPPLLVQQIVDEHLALGRSEGLLWIAALYLGATAAVQGMGFLTEYLTAIIAQGVLRRLRVRLFAHLQTLPLSYYDRTPLGDTISRCTADVETVSTLFTTAAAGGAVASSGGGQGGTSGATVLMGVVRLGTIAAAMVALSPLLSLVAALAVVPVVLVTRYFQVRVRDAERASRQAVGLQNTHLQEMLGGVEVIRALGSEAAFIARFRAALRDGLAAYNRATVYSALYIPLMVILSTLAMALVLWVGVAGQGLLASLDISLGTLTAFVLLLQRFFVPIMSLGNEWQTVQAALAGLERIFQVLALPSEAARAREPAPASIQEQRRHRDAGGVLWLPAQPPGAAWRVAGGAARGAHRPGGTDWRREEQRLTPAGRTLHPVERDSPGGWRRPHSVDRRPASARAGRGPAGGATLPRHGVRQSHAG